MCQKRPNRLRGRFLVSQLRQLTMADIDNCRSPITPSTSSSSSPHRSITSSTPTNRRHSHENKATQAQQYGLQDPSRISSSETFEAAFEDVELLELAEYGTSGPSGGLKPQFSRRSSGRYGLMSTIWRKTRGLFARIFRGHADTDGNEGSEPST